MSSNKKFSEGTVLIPVPLGQIMDRFQIMVDESIRKHHDRLMERLAPDDSDQLLNHVQAGKVLGVHAATVKRYRKMKKIPYVEVAGVVKFRKGDLMNLKQ